MEFASMHELLLSAQQNGYAVPGFNIFNLESLQAVVEAANEERAPVIVMAEQRDLAYAGMSYVYHMMLAARQMARVPMALHLDHGNDLDIIKKAVEIGFSSVMIDGSQLPFNENIQITRHISKFAAAKGVSVEAELGHVGGGGSEGEGVSLLTDPSLVAEFVDSTRIQALAIAIGTAHGIYKSVPKLDFARLEAIASNTRVPLVLHGGSGTPDADLHRAISLGICKINVGTDIRRAFVAEIVRASADLSLDVRDVFKPAKQKMKEIVKDRIRVFGAAGKA